MERLLEDMAHKEQNMDREVQKRDRIEDELKDKKKEHAKLVKELTKIDQAIKNSVNSGIEIFRLCKSTRTSVSTVLPKDSLHQTSFIHK